jgi:bacterioferritin-associated ferredoxin
MKKNYNLTPTHNFKFSSPEGELIVHLDIDSKKELINGIYFTGSLREKFQTTINVLEDNFSGVSISSFAEFLPSENEHLLPGLLLLNSIKDYLGIYTFKESQNYICSCYGLTKKELKQIICQENLVSFGQLTSETKATTGCGSCIKVLKDSYVENVVTHFKGKIFLENFNESGKWLEHRGNSYGQTLIMVDDVLAEWLKSKGLNANDLEIKFTKGFNLYCSYNDSIKKHPNYKLEFEKLVFDRLGLLVFFFDEF